MSQENVDLTRRAFQAFDDRDLDALLAMMDEGGRGLPESWPGWKAGCITATKESAAGGPPYYDTFPDFRAEVLEVRDGGDLTIATLRIRGRGAESDTPVDATVWQLTEFRERQVRWMACLPQAARRPRSRGTVGVEPGPPAGPLVDQHEPRRRRRPSIP